jgi:hypothetical protein
MFASSDEDDDCASITYPSDSGGLSYIQVRQIRVKKRKSKSGSVFRAWQFHFVIKTDLCDGPTAVEKEKLLREHLNARTGHDRPLIIIGVVVFWDRSLFSQPPVCDGLVSIEMLGYVQANNTIPLSTMKKWMESAT